MAKKYLLLIASVFCFGILANAQCSVTAGFTAPTVCFPMPVGFTNTSTGGAVVFLWRFGDSTTSMAASPTHNYKYPGTFKVTLIAGTTPCLDSTSQTISVFPLPDVNFSMSSADTSCAPACFFFNDLTTISSGTIANYTWNFGDGGTSTSANPNHCYVAPGKYYVIHTVASSQGCSNSTMDSITVYSAPITSFTASPNPTKPGVSIIFTDTNSYNGKVTYYWNFGDGNTDTAKNPSHSYANSGTYNAWLVVTNASGCKDSSLVAIVVNPVGIQSINNGGEGISIYPNPSSGRFVLKANGNLLMANPIGIHSDNQVEVYNVLGEKVYSELSVVHFPLSIDISAQPTGMYFVKVTSGQSTKVMKVVKE